jgi:adenine-specific DNA-methyltransferase
VEQYLSKIKAIRRIAHKLIDFLAQIQNFQKMNPPGVSGHFTS